MKNYLTLNLEQQVAKNANDILAIVEGGRLLGELGIVVVGNVANESELPDPTTYLGAYGDAYLVGIEPPYDYYIFTRPFVGESVPQWFNIGQFPLPGPKGDPGVVSKGDQGERGSLWYVGQTLPDNFTPTTSAAFRENDCYLQVPSGDVYVFNGTVWVAQQSIIGPRGIQGERGIRGTRWFYLASNPTTAVLPNAQDGDMCINTTNASVFTYSAANNKWTYTLSIKGPQGEQGKTAVAVTIVAELPSTDQLPEPTEAIRNNGYLVDINGIYHLYVITQTSIEDPTLIWTDMGQYGGYYDIVYSPNGTMLSQKLDGNGSFEFVNEPANITSKQFTEATRVGAYSVSLGGKSAATGKRALAEGTSTWAEGNYSHAEGNKSLSRGAQSHAEGAQTYAQGDESHAEGYFTHAQGLASHAEGAGTLASGAHSHAEGGDTVASNDMTHAEGINTVAAGYASHAEGNHTQALHDNSHASGWYSRTSRKNQVVIGQSNKDDENALFIVGNGIFDSYNPPSESYRKNAFAVMSSTTPTIKIGNTTLTEAQLQALLNLI